MKKKRTSAAAEHRFGRNVIRKFFLDNGLRVIVWEDRSSPVAAYHTWFGVGSAQEHPGRTGMAHLFEHLMFKETKNLKAGEFDRILETNGVNTNAATWLDWTYYRENLPAEKLELVMRLEADRMENMVLNREQVDTEREVVRNERLLRVDNDPEGLADEVLYHRHFGEHPYGHPTIGWMKDIEAITLEDCFEFHRRYYCPGNAVVVVVGDVSTADVLDLAGKYYGHMASVAAGDTRMPKAPFRTGEPEPSSRRMTAPGSPEPVSPGTPALISTGAVGAERSTP